MAADKIKSFIYNMSAQLGSFCKKLLLGLFCADKKIKKKVSGFTIVELLVWITIIGAVFGMSMRMLFQKKPLDHVPHLVKELNNLSLLAQQQAISGDASVRLRLKLLAAGGFEVILEHALYDKNKKPASQDQPSDTDVENELNFEPMTLNFLPTTLVTDSVINISFEGKDVQVDENAANKNEIQNQKLIYYFNSGNCERVVLKLSKPSSDNTYIFVYALNPITCRFEEVE